MPESPFESAPGGSEAVAFSLPVDVLAPASARRRVRLLTASNEALQSDLELLLTELVTNVVRHSGLAGNDRMIVTVRAGPDSVLVEVKDNGLGFEDPEGLPRRPSPTVGGYGLMLVDRIASRWGVAEDRPTSVWFELKA
jgi:anti-sigma regulatory factor (Ser/Thr protein kinase)